jgi:SP family sugar:H+ symporter-like MFS transporter
MLNTIETQPAMASQPHNEDTRGLGALFRKMTFRLFVASVVTALMNLILGIDTTSFGGVQNIPAFQKEFGTRSATGTYALSPSRASFMSSVAFSGKFVGTLVRPP